MGSTESTFADFMWRFLIVLLDYAAAFGPTPEFKGTSTSSEDPRIADAWWWVVGLVAGIMFLLTVSAMVYYCRRSRQQRKPTISSRERQAHYAALLEENAAGTAPGQNAALVSSHSLQTWEQFHPVASIPVSDPLLGGASSGNYGTATPPQAPSGSGTPLLSSTGVANTSPMQGAVAVGSLRTTTPPPPPVVLPSAIGVAAEETSPEPSRSEEPGLDRDRSPSAVVVAKCLVCLEERAKFALIPCGHLALCRECQQRFKESNQRRCPVCRQEWIFCNEIYF